MSKSFLKFVIPLALLTLFVVLTAVLCSSAVFHGTYIGEDPKDYKYHLKYKVVFGDNTVSYTLGDNNGWGDTDFGFYERDSDDITLRLTVPYNRTVTFKRKNVFTIVLDVGTGSTKNEIKLYCHGAIWLQIFYSAGTVASAAFLIMQILQQRKQQDNT